MSIAQSKYGGCRPSLSPSTHGEREEAGPIWPAEGEGRLLAPHKLPPLTLTLSPYRTGRGNEAIRR